MVKRIDIEAKDVPMDKPFVVDIDKTLNKHVSRIKTDEEINIEMSKRKDMEATQRLARIGATNAAKVKENKK